MSTLVARPAQPSECSRAARFSSNESGSVAILFSLTAVVVLAMVGGAIDYGRAVHARYQIQEAVDSAVLAAARVWQTEADIVLAQEKGTIHYNNNKPKMFSSEVASFSPDFINNTISMSATGLVSTPFLSPIGINHYTVGANATARLDVGENAGHSVEISLMLDVTGSMCEDAPTCSKLKALKNAVAGDPNVPNDKGLIDIVIWDDQSEYTSKIALIPFAEAVNVGTTTLADSVRGPLRTDSCLNSSGSTSPPCTSFGTTETTSQWVWGKPATWYKFTKASGFNTNTYKVSDRCVTERVGASAYTDDAPDTQERRVGPAYLSSNNLAGNCGGMVVSASDPEVNSIQPLTSDKALLKRRISKLAPGSGTAGQIGTAWAWYMLSPNWAYLWPSANQPKAYNTDKLVKYAILMTDGEYNTMHCNGARAKNSNSPSINCNATNGQAYTQARTLCTSMKNKGVTVYTVGFQLDSQTAIDTLQQCASSPDKFFNAEDGVTLKLAFQAIALQIAKLSLSQ